MARIDAPRLEDIKITLFSQPTMDVSELGRFIQRTEMQTSLIEAVVKTSARAISVSFTDSSASTPLRLQISCGQLDWQLSTMAQVCDQISPFLSRVEDLAVNTIKSTSGQGEADGEQWLELVLAFGSASLRNIRIAVSSNFLTSILRALSPANGSNATVLPALRHLRVEEPLAMDVSLWDAFRSSRRLSGHYVELQLVCHICENIFTQLEVLKGHLGAEHGYLMMCLYCSDFECELGMNDLFLEHLTDKHPGIARIGALKRSRAISTPDRRRLVEWHSSMRASEITTPSIRPSAFSETRRTLTRTFPRSTDCKAPWAKD